MVRNFAYAKVADLSIARLHHQIAAEAAEAAEAGEATAAASEQLR